MGTGPSASWSSVSAWLALPVTLPFFGGYLNLLPLLMTGITLLTSRLQRDPHLTPDLHRAQQLRLYLMAGAFFLLFYTFPAGMVLYWTTNNVLHLGKIILIPPKSNHS
jgi:membrane protein insertase Oxa1/YidC/SpoIIIJ